MPTVYICLFIAGVYAVAFNVAQRFIKHRQNWRFVAISTFITPCLVFTAAGCYLGFIGYADAADLGSYQTTYPVTGIIIIAMSLILTLAGVLRILHLKKEDI